MAVQPICKIEGCGKPSRAYGWCNAHYNRWCRHGNALAGRSTYHGDPQKYFREVVLTDERGPDDPCLIWPFGRSGRGYAMLFLNGRSQLVSRAVCEECYGPAPTPDHEAAHGCGCGQNGCVTKGHLRWATPVENKADELLHGTRNRGSRNGQAKLTESQAREILALKGQQTQRAIAAQFGVSHIAVGDIHRGERWAWL